jgi:hypothetical protein
VIDPVTNRGEDATTKERLTTSPRVGPRAVPFSSTPAGRSTCRAVAPDQRGGLLLSRARLRDPRGSTPGSTTRSRGGHVGYGRTEFGGNDDVVRLGITDRDKTRARFVPRDNVVIAHLEGPTPIDVRYVR